MEKTPPSTRLQSAASQLPGQRLVGDNVRLFCREQDRPIGGPEQCGPWVPGQQASTGPRIPSPQIYGLYSQQIYTLCGFVFIVLLLHELASYLRHINLLERRI